MRRADRHTRDGSASQCAGRNDPTRGPVTPSPLQGHPELREQAEEIATSLLTDVDRGEVADEVVAVYLDQSYLDIAPRVGRQPHRGYVHETEAQWELLEEVLQPFLDDIERLAALDLYDDAVAQAAGVVEGLARLRDTAGEKTLIGWGALEDDAAALAEGVRITCEKAGVAPIPEFLPR